MAYNHISLKNTLCGLILLLYPAIIVNTTYSQEILNTEHSKNHHFDMYKHYQKKLKFHTSPDNLNPSHLFITPSAFTQMKYFKKKKEYTESESLLQVFGVMTYIYMKTTELKPKGECLLGVPSISSRKTLTLEKHQKCIKKMKSVVDNIKLDKLTPRDQTYLHEMITLLDIECNNIKIHNYLSQKEYNLSYTLLNDVLTTYTSYYNKSATPAFLLRLQDTLLGRILYIKYIERDYYKAHKNYFHKHFSKIIDHNKNLTKEYGEAYSLYNHYMNKY